MAHLAIAHLAFRQTYGRSGSLNQGIRKLANQFVVSRFPREGNSVSISIGAIAPSIEYSQQHWFRSFSHGRFLLRVLSRFSVVIPDGAVVVFRKAYFATNSRSVASSRSTSSMVL